MEVELTSAQIVAIMLYSDVMKEKSTRIDETIFALQCEGVRYIWLRVKLGLRGFY